jgi:hypothetical protein
VNLAEAQARFYALVTARDGVAATVAAGGPDARRALEEMVAGNERLPAAARLEIYADMYFARIRDVLAEEYPRTLAALGAAAFQDLVADYLHACRPSHPSLREVGARLPPFLATATHPAAAERPWLAELAALERARLELFDGPDADPLTVEALRARPPETFATLPLRLVPSHALLETRFDVAARWRSDDPAPEAPAPATLIIWRRDGEVSHRTADAEEAGWLRRLADSKVPFEALCAALATDRTDQAAAARAFDLLGRWVSDGLLRADA